MKEIVPRAAIAMSARWLYGRLTLPFPCDTGSRMGPARGLFHIVGGCNNTEHRLEMSVSGESCDVAVGSEEEFITEHYWGYVRGKRGTTTEYRVAHPRWRVQVGNIGPVHWQRCRAVWE